MIDDDNLTRVIDLALRWQIEEIDDDSDSQGLRIITMSPGMKKKIEGWDLPEFGLVVRVFGVDDLVSGQPLGDDTTPLEDDWFNLVLVTLPTRPVFGSDRRLNVAANQISSLLSNCSLSSVRALLVSHDSRLLRAFMDHMDHHELIHEFDHVVKWGPENDLALASHGSLRTLEGWVLDKSSLKPLGNGIAFIGVVDLCPVGH